MFVTFIFLVSLGITKPPLWSVSVEDWTFIEHNEDRTMINVTNICMYDQNDGLLFIFSLSVNIISLFIIRII